MCVMMSHSSDRTHPLGLLLGECPQSSTTCVWSPLWYYQLCILTVLTQHPLLVHCVKGNEMYSTYMAI